MRGVPLPSVVAAFSSPSWRDSPPLAYRDLCHLWNIQAPYLSLSLSLFSVFPSHYRLFLQRPLVLVKHAHWHDCIEYFSEIDAEEDISVKTYKVTSELVPLYGAVAGAIRTVGIEINFRWTSWQGQNRIRSLVVNEKGGRVKTKTISKYKVHLNSPKRRES